VSIKKQAIEVKLSPDEVQEIGSELHRVLIELIEGHESEILEAAREAGRLDHLELDLGCRLTQDDDGAWGVSSGAVVGDRDTVLLVSYGEDWGWSEVAGEATRDEDGAWSGRAFDAAGSLVAGDFITLVSLLEYIVDALDSGSDPLRIADRMLGLDPATTLDDIHHAVVRAAMSEAQWSILLVSSILGVEPEMPATRSAIERHLLGQPGGDESVH